MQELDALSPLAPHHQPHNLAAIQAVAETAPDLPQVACFDTAFHASQGRVARMLPLPAALREQLRLIESLRDEARDPHVRAEFERVLAERRAGGTPSAPGR